MRTFLRKKLVIAALIPAFGMPFAVSSFAQTSDMQGARTGQSDTSAQGQKSMERKSQQATKIRDMRASKIIGADVKNVKGDDLGDVQDLIVNADDGKVDYAIVAFGGTLGFGEKLFAYPMDRFKAGTAGDELVLNASEEEMKNAPGFDRSNWPTWGTSGYRGEVEKHFGQTAQTGGNLVRMSEMLDTKVVDKAGNGVGEIEDVVVSITDGKVRYVALEPAKELNMGDRLAMLPMNAIRATGEQTFERRQQAQQRDASPSQPPPQEERAPGQPPRPEASIGQTQDPEQQQARQQARQQDQDLQLVLNVEPQQLQKARTFQQDQWPDVNDQSFQREMDSYVASFPSAADTGTSAGASGTQGETGSSSGASGTQGQSGTSGASGTSGSDSGMREDKPAGTPPSSDDKAKPMEKSGQSS